MRLLNINDFPDEILVKVLQHFTLVEKTTILPRVCSKWRRICGKGVLWNVIAIPPSCAKSRSITKILRCYAGPTTKVLRIKSYPPNDRPKKGYSSQITENTWELVLKSCPNLVELCIEATDVTNLKNMWLLPSSICRIFIIDCYNPNADKGLVQMLTNPIRHPNLELLSTRHSPKFIAKVPDLKAFSKNKSITHVAISQNHRILDGCELHTSIQWMTQLTHLDLNAAAKGFYDDDLSVIIHNLVNLEQIDLSDNVIDTRVRIDFENVWKEIWQHKVPKLTTLTICLVSFRNREHGLYEEFLDLKKAFRDRFDVKVTRCNIRNPNDHNCKGPPLLPLPVAFIPL